MKRIVMIIAALAFAAASPAAAQDGPIKQRQELMKKNGAATKLSGEMVKGEKPYDPAAAAEAMTTVSGSIDEFVTLFPEGSAEGSDAKPEIWQDKADFEALAQKTKEASAKAAEAAEGGLETFMAAFAEVGRSCGGCHEKYRVKKQ
jgi:cytochrome c556